MISVISSNTQYASAENQTQPDLPVSFDIITSNDQGMEIVLSAPFYQISKIKQQDKINLIDNLDNIEQSINQVVQRPIFHKITLLIKNLCYEHFYVEKSQL